MLLDDIFPWNINFIGSPKLRPTQLTLLQMSVSSPGYVHVAVAKKSGSCLGQGDDFERVMVIWHHRGAWRGLYCLYVCINIYIYIFKYIYIYIYVYIYIYICIYINIYIVHIYIYRLYIFYMYIYWYIYIYIYQNNNNNNNNDNNDNNNNNNNNNNA